MADITIEAAIVTDINQVMADMRKLAAIEREFERKKQQDTMRDMRNRQQLEYQAKKNQGFSPQELGDLREKHADLRNQKIHEMRKAQIKQQFRKIDQAAAVKDAIKGQRDYERSLRQELRNSEQNQRNLSGQQKQLQLGVNSGRRMLPNGMPINPGMVQRSREAEKGLLRLQSAAAGVMTGSALLRGNITSLGFSLIFLRFSMVPLVALFAGLTVGLGILSKSFKMVWGSARQAGMEMESFGQQQATFFQSAEVAHQLEAQAERIARTSGIGLDEARKMTVEMKRAGLEGTAYEEAILNASAGTGEVASSVANDLRMLVQTQGGATEAMVKDFAQKYGIDIRNYGDTLAIANAMTARFQNGMVDFAQTQKGLLGQLSAAWAIFKTTVGTVSGEIFKMVLKPVIAFVDALKQGFEAAKKKAEADGSMKKNMDAFQASLNKAMPYLIKFGYLLGTLLFKSIMIAVKVIKWLIDAAISLWQKLKPILDWLINAVQWLKQIIDRFLAWLGVSEGLAAALLGVAAALGAIWWFFAHENETEKLTNSIKDLTKAMDEAKTKTDDLKAKLGELNSVEAKPKVTLNDKTTIDNAKARGIGERIATIITQGMGGVLGGLIAGVVVSNAPQIGIGLAAALMAPFQAAMSAAVLAIGFLPAILIVGAMVAAFKAPELIGNLAGALGALIVGALIIGVGGIIALIYIQISTLVNGIAEIFKGFADIIIGIVTGDWRRAFHGAFELIKGLFDISPLGWIAALMGRLLGAIPGIEGWAKTIKNWFMHPFDSAKEIGNFLIDILGVIGEWGGKAILWLIGWAADFGKGIGDAFHIGWAVEIFKNEMSPLMDFIGSWDGYYGMLGFIHTGLDAFGIGFDWVGNHVFQPLIDGAESLSTTMISTFGSWDDGTGLIGHIHTAISGMISFFTDSPALFPIKLGFDLLANSVYYVWEVLGWIIDRITHLPSPPGWMMSAIESAGGWASFIKDLGGSAIGSISSIGSGGGGSSGSGSGTGGGGGYSGSGSETLASGGVIPGLLGTRRLVMAEAGERFLGAPGPNADNRLASLGGGGSVMISFDLRGSVISNDAAIEQLANKVVGKVNGALRVNRNFTFHRI